MAEPMAVALPCITRVDTQAHGEAPGPGNPAPALAPPAPASSVALEWPRIRQCGANPPADKHTQARHRGRRLASLTC